MRYRMVRQFGPSIAPSTEKCYRIETEELLTAKEALALMEELGSPYGNKPEPPRSVLQDRIDAGLADPISDEERRIVKNLREFYERTYGK